MKYYQAVIGGCNLDVPVQLFAKDVYSLPPALDWGMSKLSLLWVFDWSFWWYRSIWFFLWPGKIKFYSYFSFCYSFSYIRVKSYISNFIKVNFSWFLHSLIYRTLIIYETLLSRLFWFYWMDVVVSKEDDDDVYEEEYGYGDDGHGQLTGPRAEAKLAFLGFS